jgi:hypothetical protein
MATFRPVEITTLPMSWDPRAPDRAERSRCLGFPPASLDGLRDELAELRTILRSRAKAVSEDVEVAAVGEAEVAASQGDEKKVFAVLRRAGRWSLTAAQEVGPQIAAAAITKGIGAG